MQEDLLDKEARTEESNADDEQYFFDALDGHDYFFGVVEEEIKSSETMSYSLLSALTTSENKDSGKNWWLRLILIYFSGFMITQQQVMIATMHRCTMIHLCHPSIELEQLAEIVTVNI